MIRKARVLLAATGVVAAVVTLPASVMARPSIAPPHVGAWEPMQQAKSPGVDNGLAYDSLHRQLLMIGATCTGYHVCQDPVYASSDNARTWRLISAGLDLGQVEAYSPSEVETLVAAPALGGVVHICCGDAGSFGYTFEQVWNGSSWSSLGTTGNPGFCNPAGGGYGYDSVRGVIVEFCFGATYTYNGSTWSLQHPVHTPTGQRIVTQMTFDPATRSVLLVAFDAKGVESTWLWNGVDWRLAEVGSFATAPPYPTCAVIDEFGGVTHAGLATDTRDGAVLLNADCDATTKAPASWSWNGKSWTRQLLPLGVGTPEVVAAGTPSVGPSGTSFLAYDSALGSVVTDFGTPVTDYGTPYNWWRWTGLT